jgi:uncharacterized membrane protein
MPTLKKSPRVLFLAVILGLFTLFLAACASQRSSNAAPQANTDSSKIDSSNAVSTAAVSPTSASKTTDTSGSDVSFTKDIMPIMQTSCISCHGGEKTSKGLDLKTFASLMAGSQFGAVVTPGDAANSKLVQSVQSGKMPKRGAKLTPDQIQLLVSWVNAGAKNN